MIAIIVLVIAAILLYIALTNRVGKFVDAIRYPNGKVGDGKPA